MGTIVNTVQVDLLRTGRRALVCNWLSLSCWLMVRSGSPRLPWWVVWAGLYLWGLWFLILVWPGSGVGR